MKSNAFALLIIFMSFVTLPAVWTHVCKNVDISNTFNFTEEKEEKHKNGTEKQEEVSSIFNQFELYNAKDSFITREFLFAYKNSSLEIFLPPPEQYLM